MMLSDPAAERAVLAGICRFGAGAYFDVADLINDGSFTIDSNSVIYSCSKQALEADDTRKLDVPTILSTANELGFQSFFSTRQELDHLGAILKFPVAISNVRKFGAKIRKLQIARMMHDQLEETRDAYTRIKGDESISHILGLAEEAIFNFTELLSSTDDSPKKLFVDLEAYLEEKAKNPVDQIGISTGWNKFDFAIGGGLRKGTVNIIGARSKVGKSLIGLNMGVDIAKRGIPVLFVDTEMTEEDQKHRGTAMISYETQGKSTINDVETGQFASTDYRKEKLLEIAREHKDTPFYHINIGGKAFEEQLSIMRRWIAREVGVNDQGKANDCVIVYDYLKLMDSAEMQKSDLKEFQLLGFMMTALHNFAVRYNLPILGFIQLNRDGITKESTDAASGSDRIIWLCSNFSIYKEKSDEEIAKDGEQHGNRKMVPIIARHGQGLKSGDYINVYMKGEYGKLIEGKTAIELLNNVESNENTKNEDDVPF
jgi:replicative DNA helicase